MVMVGNVVGLWMLLGGMFLLLLLGARVAYVLLAVGLIGCIWVLDPSQPLAVGETIWESIRSYSLTAIPLFVFMAEILSRADITGSAYRAIAAVLGPMPGGAAYATIAGSTIFAAVSGSSVANAASLGAIAGPAMVDLGFSRRLTFGAIAAGGTIGILMPPSTAMIIYSSLTGVSVEKLFIAGVIPAIVLAILFAVVVLIWSLVRPEAAPRSRKPSRREVIAAAIELVPVLLLIVFVLGGIYVGIFTATEAAGMGVAAAITLAAFRKKLSFKVLWEAAEATTILSSMVLLIIAGAAVLTYVIGMVSLPTAFAAWIADLGFSVNTVLILFALMYVVLGLFIEAVSLIVLTVPVVFPVLTALGVGGVWLGVYVVILIEIALIHPPVGLNLYVLERIPAGQTMNDIILGALPFLLALFALLALIIVFPPIVTWLPSTT
jgi:C4-dicarboxylate transporter DctM subunit